MSEKTLPELEKEFSQGCLQLGYKVYQIHRLEEDAENLTTYVKNIDLQAMQLKAKIEEEEKKKKDEALIQEAMKEASKSPSDVL